MTNEYSELERSIVELNDLYREGKSIVSDQTYDTLINRLSAEQPDSALLKKGVIETADKLSRKQKLPIPMFSLNKVKSIEAIKAWAKSKGVSNSERLIITPKYDGISLVVDEANNDCWTRGDGEFGQFSKFHFNKLRGCNDHIVSMFTFGEAIMPKKNFELYKSEFANPRNMVGGLFNRDITTMPLKDVDYIRYGSDHSISDKIVQMYNLNKLNCILVPTTQTCVSELTVEKLDDLYKLWSTDYQIDGLVIDIDSAKIREQLGREENMNPAYAIAYKNPEWSGSAEVVVTGITWQVSKQGKQKPVIQIEPTEVSGVVISNVAGYNAKYIIDNKIAIGSVIKIIRSGDVIPKHIETISYLQMECVTLEVATRKCSCCGTQTKWDETKTELICINPDCKDKKIAKLVHFFSTLEIEEFGEPSIIRLYNAGFETIKDILNINWENLINIDGFAEKSASYLLEQFHKLKKVVGKPFAQFIDSLDLMDGKLGQKTIQLIFDNSDTSDWVKSDILTKIHGIAEVSAVTFIVGMDKFWMENYDDLPIKISYIISPKQEVTGNKFEGQKICFTGCRPTKEHEKEIQLQGGEIVSGVSKNTTLLVVKNTEESTMSSSKAVKARELRIKIIELNKL